jgi:hypothetical protein
LDCLPESQLWWPGPDRLPLLLPANEAELETNLTGGSVTAEGVTTFYCEEGYYTPFVKPGSEPCKRVNLVIPGQSSHDCRLLEPAGWGIAFLAARKLT